MAFLFGSRKKTPEQLVDLAATALSELAELADDASEAEKEKVQEEGNILTSIDNQFKPLMSVKELAKGVEYTDSMETGWRPPAHIRALSEEDQQAIRDKWHILVGGRGRAAADQELQGHALPRAGDQRAA